MTRLQCILAIAVLGSACGGTSPTQPAPAASTSAPAASNPSTSPDLAPSGPAPSRSSSWDLDAQGVPRFITHHYIDLPSISRISRFRSGEGHDYSDSVETCRSMKHYFVPRYTTLDASTIPVYSPIDGEIFRLRQEWAGVQIEIRSKDYPAFRPILFHVNATIPLSEGMSLAAGQRLGTHIGAQTGSDVAIAVDSTQGLRYVSWFDAITDELMASFTAQGMASRSAAIISRAERDASPLTCSAGAFANAGFLQNWVTLR